MISARAAKHRAPDATDDQPEPDGGARPSAIAEIAPKDIYEEVADNFLWYHAGYVAPVWRHALTRETQIGAHIFYS